MSKHTPGPWFFNFEAGRYVISHQGNFGPHKALAITGGFYPDLEANARLIAAAPELLEALQMLLEFPNTGPATSAARAAIAKATGERP